MEVLTGAGVPSPARVELRQTAEADAEAFLELWLRNRDFMRPWEPERPPSYYTVEGIRWELTRADLDREGDRAYVFGIWTGGGGELVGRVALANVVRGVWQNATIGYAVSQDWGGRGVATEAVRQALEFAFGTAALHRVQAAVMPRNERSLRVVRKNRFRFEGAAERYLQINGTWEDHHIYAITREEW